MSCPKKKMRAKKIDDNQKKGNRKFAEIDFGGIKIDMQLDSGADVTIINTDTWEKIGTPSLDKSSVSLSAVNGTPIEVGSLSKELSDKYHEVFK